jgi:hypothetical protein
VLLLAAFLKQLLEKIETIPIHHPQIRNDDVCTRCERRAWTLLDAVERTQAWVGEGENLIAAIVEEFPQDLPYQGVVV